MLCALQPLMSNTNLKYPAAAAVSTTVESTEQPKQESNDNQVWIIDRESAVGFVLLGTPAG
jgi:hypothetical protein